MNTFTSKLSTSRGVERSRIWLQGERLKVAGFTVGKSFGKAWSDGTLVLRLGEEGATVSGKGDLPIIDIVGAKVREAFPDCTHVSAVFERGKITITRAAD